MLVTSQFSLQYIGRGDMEAVCPAVMDIGCESLELSDQPFNPIRILFSFRKAGANLHL